MADIAWPIRGAAAGAKTSRIEIGTAVIDMRYVKRPTYVSGNLWSNTLDGRGQRVLWAPLRRTIFSLGFLALQRDALGEPQPKNLLGFIDAA